MAADAYSTTKMDNAMAHAPERNEVQTVTITGTPTGGTFTLTYAGQTTAGIAFDADAATVQAALEALSNIAVNEPVCTGGPLPGTAVVVSFALTLGSTNLAAMTASGASLTGGTSPAVAISTTTGGYGAQKVAINAAFDTLGGILDTQLTASSASGDEINAIWSQLYALAANVATILKDQTS